MAGISFDKEFRTEQWFDPELLIEVWMDEDFVLDIVVPSTDNVYPYENAGYYPS